MRKVICCVVVTALIAQTGCAGLMGKPSGLVGPPPDPGSVALVVETPPLLAELLGVPRGKPDAAASAAGTFFLQCATSIGGGAGGGEFAGVALILWLAGCGIATPVVAGIAAHKAQGTDAVASSTAIVSDSVALSRMDEEIRRAVLKRAEATTPGRILSGPATASAQSELRLKVAKVTLLGQDKADTPVRFAIQFDASLVRLTDGHVLRSATLPIVSESRKLGEWSADEGRLVTTALSREIPRLAEAVVEFTFQLFPFPFQGLADPASWCTGLKAEYPPPRGTLFGDPLRTKVESLRPTFRWETFPRAVDRKADPDTMRRIEKISYDLVIAEEHNESTGPVVYRREALPSSSHSLDINLRPDQRYLWSVRARFELDGRIYVTEWSELGGKEKILHPAPSMNGYLFRTP